MPLHTRPKSSKQESPIILIVDDELDVLIPLAEILQALIPHASIFAAESVPKALEFASRESVDLVITDYRMPDMTGEELLVILSQSVARPASIMMTAFPSEGLAYRAVNDSHVSAILSKPFDAAIMAEKAIQLLESRAAMKIKSYPTTPTKKASVA